MSRSIDTPGRAMVQTARTRFRPGFLVSFSLLGLLVVGALAWALSTVIASTIRNQQISSSQQTAQLLAQLALAPSLRAHIYSLDPAELHNLDQVAIAAEQAGKLSYLVVWDRRGQVVYATNHRLIGRRFPLSPQVLKALAGNPATDMQSFSITPLDRIGGKQIVVSIPLYGKNPVVPIAAFEMRVPDGPVATEIRSRTQRLDLILFGVALLFYAAIWPRLRNASRALRSQADVRRQRLLREVNKAIDSDQLLLHYQPKIDLDTGRVDSMEALLRWNHPKRGMIPPDEFLPVAADSELIGPLTVHIIDKALRDCQAWRQAGVEAGVEVNLSVANVLDPQLPVEIERLLKKWELPGEVLGLELTEAAIAAARDRAGEVLRRLSEMGVRLSIDDFGTGYSSLAVLRDLPVNEIKIDRTFVSALAEDPADQTLVRSIVGLAHELDVRVVAEGVEDVETLERLTRLGCDVGQGYYFSRPLALDDLFGWLAETVGISADRARRDVVSA